MNKKRKISVCIIGAGVIGASILKGKKYHDKRGFFQEIYLLKKYKVKVIFSAIAYSRKNVIRGLHFQKPNKQNPKTTKST